MEICFPGNVLSSRAPYGTPYKIATWPCTPYMVSPSCAIHYEMPFKRTRHMLSWLVITKVTYKHTDAECSIQLYLYKFNSIASS